MSEAASRQEPLLEKALRLEQLQAERHLFEGLVLSHVVLPHSSTPPWDDNLGMTALFHLLQYEREPGLAGLYREGLARYWSALASDPNPFFQFAHKVLQSDADLHPQTLDWFRQYELKPQHRAIKARYPADAPVVEAESEESPHHFLRNYWLGRYWGFVGEDD
jgi:hypothetical protein